VAGLSSISQRGTAGESDTTIASADELVTTGNGTAPGREQPGDLHAPVTSFAPRLPLPPESGAASRSTGALVPQSPLPRAERVHVLVRGVVAFAVLLAVLSAALYAVWGRGGMLMELPWINPFALTLQALTCLTVSVLVLGRYRVLQDSGSYWVGAGFCLYGTVLVFYVLSWPGLLPDGRSFLAVSPGTAAWFSVLSAVLLNTGLVLGALAATPGRLALSPRRWLGSLALFVGSAALLCVLVVQVEQHLPALLLADGRFAPLLAAMNVGIMAGFAVGAVLSVRAAQRGRDPLFALVAFYQVAGMFIYLWVLIATARYDLWWYLGRGLMTAGALIVLFGLLTEYVSLLQREREKARALRLRSDDLLDVEAKLRDNLARLQNANAALRESDQRKTEFIAMLSHELRNPLATISNALFVLQARAATDPAVVRVRDAAVRQCGHMARLLDDLLDVSRITRGKIQLDWRPIDLVTVAREAIEAALPQIEAKEQRLTMTLPAALPLEGDALRLTQAIFNLLHNATKYTPAGGRIDLMVGVEAGQAVVRVRDDGTGITREVLPRVFDLFEQADTSLDRASGGLGVGLAVTRSMVELHGGRSEAHSDGLGKGSEFVLRLPLPA
jgi:signal transduction histidine kinase